MFQLVFCVVTDAIWLVLCVLIDAVIGSCIAPETDLVLLVDSSGSICGNDPNAILNGCTNYRLLLDFVRDIVLAVDVNRTRVGLILFSNKARNIFYLNTYKSKGDILAAIQGLEYIGGNTNTSDALKVLKTEQFTSERGDRIKSGNAAIVITDG